MESDILCQKFYKLFPSTDAFGFFQRDDNSGYPCTPVGAEIFGWTGVDGTHLCFIPSVDKEMVFVVSPMNFGNCVYPVARNFHDFLSLLLFFGSIWPMEIPVVPLDFPPRRKQDFIEHVAENKKDLSLEHKNNLETLRLSFHLTPQIRAYEYLVTLQSEFDYASIPFSKEYSDL